MDVQFRYYTFFLTLFFQSLAICNNLHGQVNYVIVDKIFFEGNHKTHKDVILNEIDLHPGDTLDLESLSKRLSINEKRLQSIGLFTLAKINIKNWNTDTSVTDLEVSVRENWFIYPYIIFELADRNFNVWRKEQHYSFDRVNYGIALNHINFTGHKDKLKLKFQHGFTRKYEISYDYPYVYQKWGLSANVLYSENRETAIFSSGNKPVFYKNEDERKLFFQHRASLSFHNRTNAKTFQKLQLEFLSAKVDNIISDFLNPDYFVKGKNEMKYLSLEYEFKFDNTVYPLYPFGGYKLEFKIRKEGLGFENVNNLWMAMGLERHNKLGNRWVVSNRLKFKLNLLNNQLPYFLNAAIGYKNDKLTGYQLYVLDGKDFILFKTAVKFKALDADFKIGDFMPVQFRTMNTKIFFRANLDYGYSRDPYYGGANPLSNHWAYGYGPALDVILYNNFTLSCEYGITRFGEKGIFFESGFNF